MKCHYLVVAAFAALPWTPPPAFAQSGPLIVVEDRSGASTLPYYQALDLQPRSGQAPPHLKVPRPPAEGFGEADLLPVRSRLALGKVQRRVIAAPGLTPFFLVGDDDRSRAWLAQRAPILRDLGAVGLVVNVASIEALAALRALAPGLSLAPVPGDDLAQRLGLHHYPVLVTATGIEQ